MVHLVEVYELDLDCRNDIRKELNKNEWYLMWKQDEYGLEIIGDIFEFQTEKIVNDLLSLVKLGVWGHIILNSDNGDWYLYYLKDEGVEEYIGQVVYPEEPDKVYML